VSSWIGLWHQLGWSGANVAATAAAAPAVAGAGAAGNVAVPATTGTPPHKCCLRTITSFHGTADINHYSILLIPLLCLPLCRHVDSKTGQVVEPYGRIPYEAVTTYSGWVDNINTTDSTK
jgi:hypothetical protein